MCGVERARDAEVRHLHLTLAGDEDVGGFDVAVDDAARVRRGERERDGDRGVGAPVGTHPALATQDVGEAASVDVLHDDVVRAGRFTPVVDTDDVRVVEVRRGLCLTTEALDKRRVLRELRKQHLQRDRPIEKLIAGEEDISHAPAPDPALELVALVQNGGVGLRHVEPA